MMTNNNLRISEDWYINEACNALIKHCLELLHRGKLAEFNAILKETIKQNDIVLKATKPKTKKPRKARKARKTKTK